MTADPRVLGRCADGERTGTQEGLGLVPGFVGTSVSSPPHWLSALSLSATLASVVALGVLLLIAGSTQLAAALLARRWDGFFLFLLHGFLYGVAGFLTLEHPFLAGEGLTLMLAAIPARRASPRIAVALIENLPARGWLRLSASSPCCWALPSAAVARVRLWVLGMLVGIEIIVNGVTWSVLAVGVHNELVLLTGGTLVRTQDEDQ